MSNSSAPQRYSTRPQDHELPGLFSIQRFRSTRVSSSTVVDGVRVTATAAAADSHLALTISGGDAPAAQAEALVATTKTVSVQLDGGKAQPSAPVQLEFDLSGRPDIVAALTDTVVPVVESVSAADPNERDMFTGKWDSATQRLTAQVPHLTNFWVSAFNVLTAIENGIGCTFEMLRGDSTSPCREKSELTLDGSPYELTAVSPGATATSGTASFST